MVPDFALRIHAMIRALREVVLPALPGNEMLAIDQARNPKPAAAAGATSSITTSGTRRS